ncbi:peptide deformylase [Breznakia sp. PF5-3]|uniref:peptide deformylase n=1 Tax=unclassified Breznakia TaxID=2623764 RepID=UPI002406D694|nr:MULTISPECIES: peptide deformylase [unclassified Breznakia]MDF9823697.1 peptide deformylase [Breznakia sp. PM6-1]MDF9834495.1 peptide deformylase [Breznakia sp. PF5-3]MDF9837534.1 peptide deformylase [Breznakia sp. PFB2-8]MDF9859111.1 peptide deformylase [Breznakia sp. PH5-24]
MRITMNEVIKDSDPLIREKSEEVKIPLSKKDATLLKAMHQFVMDSTDPELAEKYDLRPAVGLAAIQLGELKRMIAVVVHEEDKTTEYALANPKIISHSVQHSYLANGEGCLSVDDFHEGIVPRYARITVKGYDLLSGKEVQFRARGYVAIVLQHEIDHLDGILYYDHIDEIKDPSTLNDAIVIE